MSRLKEWVRENREKAWFALCLNLLFLFVCVLIMRPGFESNDDITMMEFVNGARGAAEPHIVFQSYYLGVFYCFLYRTFPALPWYALFQYAVLLVSFSAAVCLICRRVRSTAGVSAAVLLLLFFGQECYIRIQFTKTSGIAAAAGLLLLFYAVSGERISWKSLLLGEALCCIGSMLRYRQFFACAALMVCIGVWYLLNLRRKYAGHCVRQLLRYAGAFGVLLLVVIFLHRADLHNYQNEQVWTDYTVYNRSRAQLADLGFPDYDTYEDVYVSLGLDRDAYTLFKGLDVNDPEVLSVDTMRELIRIRPVRRLSRLLAQWFLNEVPLQFFGTAVFYCFLVYLLLWVCWGRHDIRTLLSVLFEVIAFSGVYFYMYYTGRYLINRVDVGLWFAVCLSFSFFLDGEKAKVSPRAGFLICLTALLIMQRNWRDDWRVLSAKAEKAQAKSRTALETAGEDKEHLYLAKVVNTLSGGDSYGPFDRIPDKIMDNICWLGGWETNSVPILRILENYGIENPYRDMIGNDKVYLIDNNIKLTVRYLRTHYDETAKAKKVGKIGKYKVYQIESGK